MYFSILGPLRVHESSGSEIPIVGGRRRSVLLRLLLSPGQPVSFDRLAEDVWGDAILRAARSTLTSHIALLRRQLGNDRILTEAGAYVLPVEPNELDAAQFEVAVLEGREAAAAGEHQRAVDSLRQALGRWRGPALADVADMGWATGSIVRLEELRSGATEMLLTNQLALGQHHAVVALAEEAVKAQPLREERWATLMLALYRSGRQADALRTFQRLRVTLEEELGIEPSAQLIALDDAIILQKPELDWTEGRPEGQLSVSDFTARELKAAAHLVTPSPTGNQVADDFAVMDGGHEIGPTGSAPSDGTPRPASSEFPLLARRRLLDQLAGRFERRITLLVGPAGYGKTTLLRQAIVENSRLPRGEDVWLPLATEHRSTSVMFSALATGLGERPEHPLTDIDKCVEVVAQAVWARAPRQVCLLLDDLHIVRTSDPSLSFIRRLIGALPSNGHLVMASRNEVDIPVTRLLMIGEAIRLTEQDLRFTEVELDLLSNASSVPREVLSLSGGWPALVTLLSAAGYERPPLEVGLDFVWEEVLSTIDEETRNALRDISVLAGLHPVDREIADVAADRHVDIDKVLAPLPLVTKLDDGVYSLHSLWRHAYPEVDRQSGDRRHTRQRVADLLRSRGDFSAAVTLYEAVQNWTAILSTVLEVCTLGRPSVPIDELERWRSSLPTEILDAPEVALLDAVITASRDRVAATEMLNRAAVGFRETGDAEGEVVCLNQLGVIAMWLGDLATGVAVYGRERELLDSGLIADAEFVVAADAMLAHGAGEWQRVIDLTEPVAQGRPTSDLQVGALGFRSHALIGLGHPELAESLARRMVDVASHATLMICSQALVLAHSLLIDSDEVLSEAQELVILADKVGIVDHRVASRSIAAVLHARSGHTHEATRCIREADEIIGAGSAGPMAELGIIIAQAEIALAESDEESAADLLTEAILRWPLGSPGTASTYQHALVSTYVLVPEARPFWNSVALHGCWSECRAAAQALVQLREHLDLGPSGQVSEEVFSRVKRHVCNRLAVELLVAADAADALRAERVMSCTSEAGREALRRMSDSPLSVVQATARRLSSALPKVPSHEVRVVSMGPTELFRDDLAVSLVGPEMEDVRSLLLYLAANRITNLSAVAQNLWSLPDEPTTRDRTQRAVWSLKSLLEPDLSPDETSYFVASDGNRISLEQVGELHIDIQRYAELLGAAESYERGGQLSEALEAYLDALELYQGPFLLDITNGEWASNERQHVKLSFVAACVRAGELLIGTGRSAEALELAARAIIVDPKSEASRRLQAAALLAMGDRSAALETLATLRSILSELGIEAESETEMLNRLIAGPTSADRWVSI